MMNGLEEHHDDQPAASAAEPESGDLLASQADMLLGRSPLPESTSHTESPMPESGLSLSTPRADLVSSDVLDVCNAMLAAIEAEKLLPLPTVQIARTPTEAEAPSLPDDVPPDLPVPDFQTCGGVEVTPCPALPDPAVSVTEDIAGCTEAQQEPLIGVQETLMENLETPIDSQTLILSQELLLSSQETLMSSDELLISSQDAVAPVELEPVSCQEPPTIQEALLSPDLLRSAVPSLNCSRFGRMRKRPRLSPPDTPVKKQKVKATEPALIPSPAKKQVVFKVTELGIFPNNLSDKKTTKSKAETAPDKKLKSKGKATKPEPAKKLKINSKTAKPGSQEVVAPELPTSFKVAKPKNKNAPTPVKRSRGKAEAELTLTCRVINHKWNPGDVVWFKVSKEPYWPGKVTHDGATGEFKRVRGGMNEYCLLPFGQDSSCKWVLAPMMLKFHGRQQFEEHRQSLLDKHPEDSPTRMVIETKFSVTNFKLDEWAKVVQEAESGYLNGKLEAIKVEMGEKTTEPTKAALPAQQSRKSCAKTPLLGDPLLVPSKRSQKRKTASTPGAPKRRPQKKGKTEASPADQTKGGTAAKKKITTKPKAPEAPQIPALKRPKKKKNRVLPRPAAELEKPNKTSDLNDTTSSVDSTIQDVINYMRHYSSSDAMETEPGEVDPDVKPKKRKKTSTKKRKIPVKDESKKPPVPDDSRGKKARKKSPDQDLSPVRPNKKRVRTSPLKRFLNELSQHSGDSDSGSSAKKDCVPAEGKYEKVCQTCEQIIPSSDGVRCIGNCNGIFHAACTKSAEPLAKDGSYKCEECTTGLHSCFACKTNAVGDIKRCSIRLCGKFYHHACLDLYRTTRIDGDHITCSLHSCMSCALNLNATNGKKGRLVRCLRCPVAYHFAEDCLAAGSLVVSHSSIICPKHYEPKKMAKMMHVNVNWCFVCSSGGSLICCESCPASFHAECLGIVPPEGSYYCAECLAGTQPKYGIIVWVKLGSYRWWPAKIINPRNTPSNIRNMPHQVGEFPVCFFGTHDYYWTTRSRVFQFLEGDQGAHDNTANRLAKRYEKALNEACVAYHEWKIAKECRAAQDYEKNSLIPPRYKPIKVNRPVGRVSMTTADPSQMTPCDCDPNSENPCGSDSECLNRMLMFECHPSVCAAGEKCQNQRFEKRQYKPAEIFRAEGKGWGLKSLVDIRKGEFVNEYIGEIIDENECKLRMKRMHEENNTNYYFLTIDKDRIIDAARKGNLSRFMNHSCQPNCETHKWTVNGNTRVGLFAVCDIPKGTELTFNYNLDCLGNNKTTCRCEAPNCSGFIGERPKRAMQIKTCQKENDKAAGMKKKRKKKAAVKCEHEDECFRCGHDGELLMCDRKNCPKAYHLSCLDLEKSPHGRWECPWHHCDICGRVATSLCFVCPNSFCKEHAGDNIKAHEDGITYCNDHVTEEKALNQSIDSVQPKLVKAGVVGLAEPAIISLKKKCDRVKVPAAEKDPSTVPDDKRQRMIAEKLKIKLNGSKKHGFPTCRRVRDAAKTSQKKKKKNLCAKVKVLGGKTAQPNGTVKHHESAPTVKIKSVNGGAVLVNGIRKRCSAIKKKKSVSKSVLVGKVNGKAVKKKGSKSVDRSEGSAERTEKSVSPAGADPLKVTEPLLHPA